MDVPHRDPQWWRRFPSAVVEHQLQYCLWCGHCRFLHDAAGCKSKAINLFDPHECQCSNTGVGSKYTDPLARPT